MAIAPLKINIGQFQFVVDPNQYSYTKVIDLRDKMSDIRRKHSIFTKYPMLPEETREQWSKRIQTDLEQDNKRKSDESVEDHLKRLYKSEVDAHDLAYEALNAIASTFGIRAVSDQEFKDANWLSVKAFIYDVLNLGDIPCDEFFPKRVSA